MNCLARQTILWASVAILMVRAVSRAEDYTYMTNSDSTIIITGYAGTGGVVSIPSMTNGLLVTSIGSGAFYACVSMTSITIPSGVTNIGNGAFNICTSLVEISTDASNPFYDSVDGVLINKDHTLLFRFPPGKPGDYDITNGIVRIGRQAFYDCPNLTSVTIPESVTNLGLAAFSSCLSMTNISVHAGNGWYCSVAGALFTKDKGTLVQCPGGRGGIYDVPGGVAFIGDNAFEGCFNLSDVKIPDSVTSIGNGSFSNCRNLANVTLGNNVTNIGDFAFQCCGNLNNLTIPSSVMYIGFGALWLHPDYAYESPPPLSSIYFCGNLPLSGGSVFGWNDNISVYIVPGTQGWDAYYCGRPTYLWNPQVQQDTTFGLQAGCFGFTITNVGNPTIVVEACTNLTSGVWSAVSTNMLTGGSSYFSDNDLTNYPSRFYRFRTP